MYVCEWVSIVRYVCMCMSGCKFVSVEDKMNLLGGHCQQSVQS